MITWPEELLQDIARRRCVLFLGAGVSKGAANSAGMRPKDWDEFLKLGASKITDSTKRAEAEACIATGDLLTACELIHRALDKAGFRTLLNAEFLTPGFKPSEAHRTIVKIDSRIVITTNFDKIYDTCANATNNSSVLIKHYYDDDVSDVLRRTERCVLKFHGSIDRPDDAVFTRSSYARARNAHADFFSRVLRNGWARSTA